jgi:HemY protein
MRAAIKILIALALATWAIHWFVHLDGAVDIRLGEWLINLHISAAITALAVLFAGLAALLWLILALKRLPARWERNQAERNLQAGQAATTRALVAFAAGRGAPARVEVAQARKLLGDTPQLLLLAAETARLDGDEAAAKSAFEALAEREDARFLGLRGLLRQATAAEDWDRARTLAAEAEAAEPGAAWLREERAQIALRQQDWREALALSGPDAPRAALALAAAGQESDPAKAAAFEAQAFAADPGFVPGALAHAKRLRAGGHPRRARAALAQSWSRAPHPDTGAALLDGISDAAQRLALVEDFTRSTLRHPESRLLRARALLDAGHPDRARQELEAWQAAGEADRRCYTLRAEVERAAKPGPDGEAAARTWLDEAARAAREPCWRCGHCGAEHNAWKPLCQACGTAGEIRWSSEPKTEGMAVAKLG